MNFISDIKNKLVIIQNTYDNEIRKLTATSSTNLQQFIRDKDKKSVEALLGFRFEFHNTMNLLHSAYVDSTFEIFALLLNDVRFNTNENCEHLLDCEGLGDDDNTKKCVEYLLMKGKFRLSYIDNLPLRLAVQYSLLEAAKYLLSKDIDPNFNPSAYNNVCLEDAIDNGNYDMVKLFLEDKRINLNLRPDKLLYSAALSKSDKIFDLILKYKTIAAAPLSSNKLTRLIDESPERLKTLLKINPELTTCFIKKITNTDELFSVTKNIITVLRETK